jgi:hypothetical protein
LFSLGFELAQVNKVERYALNSTMALAHYNPTSTNEKALQLLSSTNSMEIIPLQLEKKPIYEEPSITQEEDDTLFGDDQEIEKLVQEIKEKEQKQKKENDLLITNQEKELAKEKIQDLKQHLINKNSKIKSTSKLFKDEATQKIQEIKEFDLKRKKNQHSNTLSSKEQPMHPLTFPK